MKVDELLLKINKEIEQDMTKQFTTYLCKHEPKFYRDVREFLTNELKKELNNYKLTYYWFKYNIEKGCKTIDKVVCQTVDYWEKNK